MSDPGSLSSSAAFAPSVVAGYRGIWFTLGCHFEYGDKYSGGLGTYTANHQPVAAYAPAVNKTFFTYGGTPAADRRHLLIMVSWYDHSRHLVPRPVVVCDKQGVDDPHDNAALTLDDAGHIWVFVSGRGTTRPGMIYRSTRPYDIHSFELLDQQEITYPQAWWIPDRGFVLLHSRYRRRAEGLERQLWCKQSVDGRDWHSEVQLAAFGGHYQTSGMHISNGGAPAARVATFFNFHPKCDVDKRSNVYYLESSDLGNTWSTAAGVPVSLPLVEEHNAALIADLRAGGEQMYTCDLNFDAAGRPVLLCIVSRGGLPGPSGDPRLWTLFHWEGAAWRRRTVTGSDHNYDMGSLYIDGLTWRIIGPTSPGPQRWATGGEMALWTSDDAGVTWRQTKNLTENSLFNHSYARRPTHAADPFYAFWADGNPNSLSKSHLYFTDSRGEHTWQLPYDMPGEFAEPTCYGPGSE